MYETYDSKPQEIPSELLYNMNFDTDTSLQFFPSLGYDMDMDTSFESFVDVNKSLRGEFGRSSVMLEDFSTDLNSVEDIASTPPQSPSNSEISDEEEEPMKPKKQQDRKSPKKEYESTKSREFEKIAVELYNHLLTGEYSYDEIVAIYKKKYPMFAEKFTAGFCSKLRCGRVLAKVTCCKRNKNSGKRIKRISRVSARKKWRKMSHPLVIFSSFTRF
eukprot:TRINITY_DN289_c0_g1_i2.p1 TRINITY_DN289_c0_g1~~TRINITY_DN289_c0_g1_i2.p1  ORF type:complete len:237 (-),score=41.63 TRINITY_DN289_c0_g1_i2:255-905(-)